MDVEITRLQLLAAELERAAEDPELVTRVFDRADLTPAQLSAAEARISAQTEASFIRHACDVLGDITFAAKAGLRVTSASSLAAYISKYSRDLKQVMENTIRFHRFIDPTLGFSMDLSGNAATLGLHWKDARFARYHRRTEFLMFAAVARMRTLTGCLSTRSRSGSSTRSDGMRRAFQGLPAFPSVSAWSRWRSCCR